MIRQIRYNFDDLEMACAEIIDSDGRRGLDKLKKEYQEKILCGNYMRLLMHLIQPRQL